MDTTSGNYTCINCGGPVKDLYKKYSATVLKLTECEHCKNIADKYLEYDTVIIIIDLILLRLIAYRHILLNSKFKNFWKLSIILLLLETYIHWSATVKHVPKETELNNTEPYLTEPDIYLEDIKFYLLGVDMIMCTICFVVVIYLFTIIYTFLKKRAGIPFLMICKMVTISSTGLFLFLPSLIWDTSVHNFHLHFISIYTTLSQLLAYKALCNCEKVWTLIIIMSSILTKLYIRNFFNTAAFVKDFIPD
ncbi:protein ARV1 [Anoplophora glabripennis]|uniref:protein ARV1 n=1 Tax=Anoplophora glabripennis TaxID=217634 RepID=UPI00087457F1|nr:protein ARV1 [Anoplophora glabripennis]